MTGKKINPKQTTHLLLVEQHQEGVNQGHYQQKNILLRTRI